MSKDEIRYTRTVRNADGETVELDDREYLAALRLMERQGGGFASNLATAWLHADGNNRPPLEREFGWLLLEYLGHVRHGVR